MTDLTKGEHFELEGALYEVYLLGERIVVAYVLDEFGERIEDETDTVCGFKTSAFSDLRFNREHENEFDREADELAG